jgi:hypothetical protein
MDNFDANVRDVAIENEEVSMVQQNGTGIAHQFYET